MYLFQDCVSFLQVKSDWDSFSIDKPLYGASKKNLDIVLQPVLYFLWTFSFQEVC